MLVLFDVTVDVLVDVLLVSTLVCESYCAAAVVVTNAAVRPAIIFIVDILSAPRLHSHSIYRSGSTQYHAIECSTTEIKKNRPGGRYVDQLVSVRNRV